MQFEWVESNLCHQILVTPRNESSLLSTPREKNERGQYSKTLRCILLIPANELYLWEKFSFNMFVVLGMHKYIYGDGGGGLEFLQVAHFCLDLCKKTYVLSIFSTTCFFRLLWRQTFFIFLLATPPPSLYISNGASLIIAADTRIQPCVGLTLIQRRRRWPTWKQHRVNVFCSLVDSFQ